MPCPGIDEKQEKEEEKKIQNYQQHTSHLFIKTHLLHNAHKTSKPNININIFVAVAIEGSFSLTARAMGSLLWPAGVWPNHFRMYLGECDNGTNRHKRY